MTRATVTIALELGSGTIDEATIVIGTLRAGAAFHRNRNVHGLHDELNAHHDAATLDDVADRIEAAIARLATAIKERRAAEKKAAAATNRAATLAARRKEPAP